MTDEAIIRRIVQEELARAGSSGGDSYSPLTLVTAADGSVSYDFDGHIGAHGLDLEASPGAPPAFANPGFDANTSNWSVSGNGTLTRDTSAYYDPPACLRVNALFSGQPVTVTGDILGTFRAGFAYTISFATQRDNNFPTQWEVTLGGQTFTVPVTPAWEVVSFQFTPAVDLSNPSMSLRSGMGAVDVGYLDAFTIEGPPAEEHKVRWLDPSTDSEEAALEAFIDGTLRANIGDSTYLATILDGANRSSFLRLSALDDLYIQGLVSSGIVVPAGGTANSLLTWTTPFASTSYIYVATLYDSNARCRLRCTLSQTTTGFRAVIDDTGGAGSTVQVLALGMGTI